MPGAREGGKVRGRSRPMARDLDRPDAGGDTGEAHQNHQQAGRGDRYEAAVPRRRGRFGEDRGHGAIRGASSRSATALA